MALQVEVLQKTEVEEWHEKLIYSALGEHGSSILSQLVASSCNV